MPFLFLIVAAFMGGSSTSYGRYALPVVIPAFETDPVSSEGDAADDTALWIHPTQAEKSLIVATDKKAGLLLFALNGKSLASVPVGQINNIDSRANVPYPGGKITLLVGSNRSTNAISMWTVQGDRPQLISLGEIRLGYVPYGICMGAPDSVGETAIFITTKEGVIDSWKVKASGRVFVGRQNGQRRLSSKVEGCVVDDRYQQLFVSEEAVGLWRFDLTRPQIRPQLVDAVAPHGSLTADVEGVAIHRGSGGTDHVVVSSQGSDSYHLYDLRTLQNRGAFQIGAGRGIDGVTHTDGIEILSAGLIPQFPEGFLIAQDDLNERGPEQELPQNFKVVDWSQVRRSLRLPR